MNIRPYLIINDKKSTEIKGLLISSLSPISKPAMRTRVETVDGRDGDIITELGFNAYDKKVEIALSYEYCVDDIIEYFTSSGRVVFSNEPDKYYNFAIYKQIDFERLLRFKQATVTLHVQPFKFSESEKTKTFAPGNDVIIRNNGNYFSRPRLTINGRGSLIMQINGEQVLTVNLPLVGGEIIIDGEEMNAYAADGTLLNRQVIGNYANIKLEKGENRIRFASGYVDSLAIDNYSRWI